MLTLRAKGAGLREAYGYLFNTKMLTSIFPVPVHSQTDSFHSATAVYVSFKKKNVFLPQFYFQLQVETLEWTCLEFKCNNAVQTRILFSLAAEK